MSWIAPHEFEKLGDVVASIELVVELCVRTSTFDFYDQSPAHQISRFGKVEIPSQRRLTNIGVDETRDEVLEGKRVEVDHVT